LDKEKLPFAREQIKVLDDKFKAEFAKFQADFQAKYCGATESLKEAASVPDGKPLIDRIRELPVGALLEMFDQQGEVSEEEWKFLRGVLTVILSYAGSFYDGCDYRHYELALAMAGNVLDGGTPEDVIRAMAGTAWFMLTPLVEEAEEEAKEFSAETRAQLERIRDVVELTAADLKDVQETTEFSIEAMLSDTVLKQRLVKWAVASAYKKLTHARPDATHEVAMSACQQVCALWQQAIFQDVFIDVLIPRCST
jgi:hypothetical protein